MRYGGTVLDHNASVSMENDTAGLLMILPRRVAVYSVGLQTASEELISVPARCGVKKRSILASVTQS
jgi:hypothetical protein